MNIVFLDIDGVLNSSKNYQEWSDARDKDKSPVLDSYAYDYLLFDADNVAVLNEITSKGEAKIVVSSSWRLHYAGKGAQKKTFADLIDLLRRVGVQADIIDKTPCHLARFSQRTSRGTEIQEWLSVNKNLGIDQFVILDDDDDMDHLCAFHVWTDCAKGLVAEDAREALLVLKGEGYVPARHRNRVQRTAGA